MDDRPESQDGPSIARVKPVMGGRGLALPPLAPMVGAMCLILGLAVGFGLAPKAAPTATSVATPATTEAVPVAPPTIPAEEPAATPIVFFAPGGVVTVDGPGLAPPSDGLSLTDALAALEAAGLGDRGSVVSARIARYGEFLPSSEAATDSWVWALTVHAQIVGPCAGWYPASPSDAPPTSADPSMPAALGWTACGFWVSQVVILDYRTGAFLGTSQSSAN